MRGSHDTIRVLHVDDDPDFTNLAATFLQREDDRFSLESVTSAEEAMDRLDEDRFDCVVSDYNMSGRDGIEFLEAVREQYPDLPFILFTGKGSEDVASEAIQAGVTDYLQKQGGTDQYALLANRIENAVSARRTATAADRDRDRLEHSTARLEALFEQSPDMINVHDAEGNIIDPNPMLCEKVGYSEAELAEMKVWELDRDIGPEEAEALWESMEVGERRDLEGAFQCRDGSTFPAEVHVRRLDLAGTDRFVAISRDISDTKEREGELERYEAIVENTEDGIYVFDADGRFDFVNQRVVDVSGIALENWLGEDVSIHVDLGTLSEAEVGAIKRGIEAIVRGDREEVRIELRPDIPDDVGVLELRLTPFRTETGPDRVVGFTRDITDRKRQEEELQRKNERLDEFASVVSHDLRNPLTVAQGNLELAKEECDTEYLDKVEQAQERMRVLIDDVLALAREGEPVDEMDALALDTLAEDCWGTVETNEATLRVETDRRIRADRTRLQRLLENLVRNAVEHGGPSVTITIGDLEDGFYVADDGPGIPPEKRQEVFESGVSMSDTGTGFGLAIAEEIAEAHGWELDLTDSDEGGARFELTGVTLADG